MEREHGARMAAGRPIASSRPMAHVILTYQTTLTTVEGRNYRPRAFGRLRGDGMWEGWLEFLPDDASEVVRSARETSQPNLADLEYWATGLTPTYLEGALERALAGPLAAEPVPAVAAPAVSPLTPAGLDPFSVYAAEGGIILREQLEALSPHELRQIVRAYGLVTAEIGLEAMTAPELIARIIAGVRTRLAA
jgi:hypothetical protein